MPLLNFALPLFSLLLFSTSTSTSTSTTTQPYNATDYYLFDCGSSNTTIDSNQIWDGDEHSKFVPPNISTTSFSSIALHRDSSVLQTPFSTARIFKISSFTYTFPVSQGPKFLRFYFYPANYSGLNPNQSYFSVSSNGFSLLTNFSAFLTASFLESPSFIKEYIICVKHAQNLTVTFTPSPNSYAFINGIEIVSMPENLYFNSSKSIKYVGVTTGPVITNDVALENVYRLNMGAGRILGTDDTGMYRSWEPDINYVFKPAIGLTPVYDTKEAITYTKETPNYTAPEVVYRTQRSMGNLSDMYNLTWLLPVDSGYFYKLRLHFCNIIPQYNKSGQVIFKIFINNQTADDEIDLFSLTQGSGYPIYKDYIVFVKDRPDGSKGKQDLWVALHPNSMTQLYHDAYLNGLEAFKLSVDGSLASPNPEVSREHPQAKAASPVIQNTKKTMAYAPIIGGVGGALVLTVLVHLVFLWTRIKHSSKPLELDGCRRFSWKEVKTATHGFDDKLLLGKGGFGEVYAGSIDKAKTINVAIKRLGAKSDQGPTEFITELVFLSKLSHDHLVPLIGYCDDKGEMILVYDYMPNGTLEEHLHKNDNPPLSWERRLDICIGAAKGLHYLHTGADRVIIHRDVKPTNILLDEKWVAKLADFGLTKLGPKDPSVQTHVSTAVKGTRGYMDPAYYRGKKLTEKSDVYSFGVVLLEVLCGRPVVDQTLPEDEINLAELAVSRYREGTLQAIVDKNINHEIDPECLKKFSDVAIRCLNKKITVRPTMEDVIQELEAALKHQEDAKKTGGMVDKAMLENQQFPFPMQVEPTTTDEDALLGSTGIRHDTSSTDTFT